MCTFSKYILQFWRRKATFSHTAKYAVRWRKKGDKRRECLLYACQKDKARTPPFSAMTAKIWTQLSSYGDELLYWQNTYDTMKVSRCLNNISFCIFFLHILFNFVSEIKLKGRMNNRTNVKPGDGVVLRCAIAGDPQAEYQWFKDDSLLTEDSVEERIVIKTFGWGSKLIISRADPSDSGHYRCHGRNAYGERSTTGLLVVRTRK